MPELGKYSDQQAQNEAEAMRQMLTSGEVSTYNEAEKAVQDGVKAKETLQSPELQEFLGKVDGALLKSIFVRIAEKCGIEPSRVNFIPLEEVISMSKKDATFFSGGLASYSANDNTIRMNNLTEVTDIEKLNNPGQTNEEILLAKLERIKEKFGSVVLFRFQTLIHEETHAVSKQECTPEFLGTIVKELMPPDDITAFNKWLEVRKYDTPVSITTGQISKSQTGVNQQFKPRVPVEHRYSPLIGDKEDRSKFDSRQIFTLLNEAITEKLAREIIIEYLDQSQVEDEETENKFRQTLASANESLSYQEEIALLNGITERLAQNADISQDKVWKALIRAMFEGETFEDNEVRELFDQGFGPNFLLDLSRLDLPSNPFWGQEQMYNEFVKKYKLPVKIIIRRN